jgi:hypothetical protein
MVNQRTVNQRMGNHTGHRVETPLLLSPKTLTPLCPISKNRIQKNPENAAICFVYQ